MGTDDLKALEASCKVCAGYLGQRFREIIEGTRDITAVKPLLGIVRDLAETVANCEQIKTQNIEVKFTVSESEPQDI